MSMIERDGKQLRLDSGEIRGGELSPEERQNAELLDRLRDVVKDLNQTHFPYNLSGHKFSFSIEATDTLGTFVLRADVPKHHMLAHAVGVLRKIEGVELVLDSHVSQIPRSQVEFGAGEELRLDREGIPRQPVKLTDK